MAPVIQLPHRPGAVLPDRESAPACQDEVSILETIPATRVDVVPGCMVRVIRLPEIDWVWPMVRAAIRACGSLPVPVSAATSASRSLPVVDTPGVPPEPFCSVMPTLCAPPPVSVNEVTNRPPFASTQLVVLSVWPPRV